jgi:hypothetical protein
MKNSGKIFIITCCLLAGFLFAPVTEIKAQVRKMSAKDLTKESSAVLYGKCTKTECKWNENRSIIFTYVTIAPEEYLKGDLGASAVIAIPGGRVGNVIYEVSETPVFTEGEEVVAFIWTNPDGKNLITGGYQGKMKIKKDSKTGKRFVEEEAIEEDEQGTDKQSPGQLKKVSLEDFTAKVKGFMKL